MSLKDFGKDDVLAAFGLETRKQVYDYMLPALGIFGAGLLVGASLGLLLAPKPGKELRADIKSKVLRRKQQEMSGDLDELDTGMPPALRKS